MVDIFVYKFVCGCARLQCTNYDDADGITENFRTASKLAIDSLIKIGCFSLSSAATLSFCSFSIFDCGSFFHGTFHLLIYKLKSKKHTSSAEWKKVDSVKSNSSTTKAQYCATDGFDAHDENEDDASIT